MWFELAADQGHPAARAFLGMMLVSGRDTAQDIGAGMELLHAAADGQGYYEAQYYLGRIYSEGKHAARDLRKARGYLAAAADQGDADAAALLDAIKAERTFGRRGR